MKILTALFTLFTAALVATPALAEEIDNKTAQSIKTMDSYVLSWQYTENPYSAKYPPSPKLAVGDLIKLRFYDRRLGELNEDGSMKAGLYESNCPGSLSFKVPKEGIPWFTKIVAEKRKSARYVFCRVISLSGNLELELLGRELRSDSKTSRFVW
jgi:hypothetical protein